MPKLRDCLETRQRATGGALIPQRQRRSRWRARLRTMPIVLLSVCVAGNRLNGQGGGTYYVSPAGSDNNPGTESQPFRTIQRAANLVNPGDTVIVEDGVYTGTGAGTPCASNTSRPVVCLTRGGTSSAWVTIRARRQFGARVDGQSNTSTHGFRFSGDANFIRLEGFEVAGIGNTNAGSAGILVYSGGHDVVITNNDIHDIGKQCTDHQYGMSGIYVQNVRVTIANNLIHDIGRYAPGENGCSPSSNNYQNHDHGIYVNGSNDGSGPGAGDVTIFNNVFSNVARGWPIQIYPDPVANLKVLNNTFANPNPYRNGHIIVAASTSNAEIVNNIFYQPTAAAINFNAGTHSNMVVTNNLTSQAIATSRPNGVTFSNNLEGTNPLFASSDYRLRSDSPAVDKGAALDEVRDAIDGTQRPQGSGWDIGAWEVASGGVPTLSAPQNVRIVPAQ